MDPFSKKQLTTIITWAEFNIAMLKSGAEYLESIGKSKMALSVRTEIAELELTRIQAKNQLTNFEFPAHATAN